VLSIRPTDAARSRECFKYSLSDCLPVRALGALQDGASRHGSTPSGFAGSEHFSTGPTTGLDLGHLDELIPVGTLALDIEQPEPAGTPLLHPLLYEMRALTCPLSLLAKVGQSSGHSEIERVFPSSRSREGSRPSLHFVAAPKQYRRANRVGSHALSGGSVC